MCKAQEKQKNRSSPSCQSPKSTALKITRPQVAIGQTYNVSILSEKQEQMEHGTVKPAMSVINEEEENSNSTLLGNNLVNFWFSLHLRDSVSWTVPFSFSHRG